jgi:hypothetical protein
MKSSRFVHIAVVVWRYADQPRVRSCSARNVSCESSLVCERTALSRCCPGARAGIAKPLRRSPCERRAPARACSSTLGATKRALSPRAGHSARDLRGLAPGHGCAWVDPVPETSSRSAWRAPLLGRRQRDGDQSERACLPASCAARGLIPEAGPRSRPLAPRTDGQRVDDM